LSARGSSPGALAAFVLPNGRVGAAATGWADRKRREPMARDARFMSGSLGKAFVASLALQLAEDDVLELDAGIVRWLGAEPWIERLPNGREATLRMLLGHRSGIPNHVTLRRFELAAAARFLLGRGRAAVTPDELIAYVLDREPLFPAGQGYGYTDTGYVLAGMILERASGRRLESLLRERLLDPLGLTLTLAADRTRISGLVTGYQRVAPLLPSIPVRDENGLRLHPSLEWAGGGLATNPQDLVRFARALFEGHVLAPASLEAMLASPSPAGEGLACGLGVFVYDTPLGEAWGHDGWLPGYTGRLLYFPQHRVAVAVQTNAGRDMSVGNHALALAEVVLERVAGAEGG
jgi:D-alanyl-D-alanine carboxypeptidase